MGGKKRRKAQTTNTSGTDLDTSDTVLIADQQRSMEVSDHIMDKLKNTGGKMTTTNFFFFFDKKDSGRGGKNCDPRYLS